MKPDLTKLTRGMPRAIGAILVAALVLFTFGPHWPGALGETRESTPGSIDARDISAPSPLDAPAVLVELFTSEGCSTCPPADKLLTDLDETQPIEGARIIALSEHVDYWNHLGWRDPFSTAEFSRRQAEYARAFNIDGSYTPQMIVDGRTQFVGSNAVAAREAIAQAARSPKAGVALAIKKSAPNSVTLAITVERIPDLSHSDKADVILAITESGLMNSVLRGENSGRKLAHSAVTRKLARLGSAEGGKFTAEHAVDLDSRWKRQNMKAVVFVQERSTRRVLGAAFIRLSNEP